MYLLLHSLTPFDVSIGNQAAQPGQLSQGEAGLRVGHSVMANAQRGQQRARIQCPHSLHRRENRGGTEYAFQGCEVDSTGQALP